MFDLEYIASFGQLDILLPDVIMGIGIFFGLGLLISFVSWAFWFMVRTFRDITRA